MVAAEPEPTRRSLLKSDRRSRLLAAAARQFAERGFAAVRLEDIGAAVDVSGPAIYRHFPNKEALLVELLVEISTRLLAGGRDVLERAADPASALQDLIDFHLDFTLNEPELIRIQDRDLTQLPPLPCGRCAPASVSTSRSGCGCYARSTATWRSPTPGSWRMRHSGCSTRPRTARSRPVESRPACAHARCCGRWRWPH